MFGILEPGILEAVAAQKALAENSVQTRGPQLAGVLGLFLGLTWLVTGLRVYVRLLISRNWAADDTVLLISLVYNHKT